MTPPRHYWFAAKRRGWGWGPPVAWQGWAILIVWIAVLAGGVLRLMPIHPLAVLALAVAMTALLLGVCFLTGEPSRWRWDTRDD